MLNTNRLPDFADFYAFEGSFAKVHEIFNYTQTYKILRIASGYAFAMTRYTHCVFAKAKPEAI
jgi:hypothetical protein